MDKSALAALIAALSLASCSTPSPSPEELVDPASASQHCEAQGGKRTVERGPGGAIGVCVFADNRQCEEWALLRGQCALGGIPVSGYATTSERHCAIRGGHMTIPGCALSPVGAFATSSVTLVLNAAHGAMLTVFSGSASRYLVPGTWESSGNVVTVSTEHERLVFDFTGDRLVPREWDHKTWGKAGPGALLLRK